MIWTPYNWLHKFYSICKAAIVGTVSRPGLTIEAHCRNQPNKSKLALYNLLLHSYNYLKQLYMSNKRSTSVIKVGVACVGVCVSRCLKEELPWASDKWLRVISNIMLFKTVIPLRN